MFHGLIQYQRSLRDNTCEEVELKHKNSSNSMYIYCNLSNHRTQKYFHGRYTGMFMDDHTSRGKFTILKTHWKSLG